MCEPGISNYPVVVLVFFYVRIVMALWVANFQVLVSHWTIDFDFFWHKYLQNGMTFDFRARYARKREELHFFEKKHKGPILGPPNLFLMFPKMNVP